jgi:hypothetical protein
VFPLLCYNEIIVVRNASSEIGNPLGSYREGQGKDIRSGRRDFGSFRRVFKVTLFEQQALSTTHLVLTLLG